MWQVGLVRAGPSVVPSRKAFVVRGGGLPEYTGLALAMGGMGEAGGMVWLGWA